ncbi:polygalacturonase [Phtheirospermum japonicum]|uniref:Polygalacturonase n=1 Tax=Phtheirospermum japonicum TaxID=374723 RepID=A0A830BJH4_9LAMI|nr:polygalacturonase [Phtheirospermum japonicum]
MDSYRFILVSLTFSISWFDAHAQSNNNFVVTHFGAVPGTTKDSGKALESAWQKACATAGGIVTVPRRTFLVTWATFTGPCNGPTFFHLHGTLIAADTPALDDSDYWISFTRVDDLTISGNGVFNGNGALSWSRCRGIAGGCKNLPPMSVTISQLTNAVIQRVRFVNSKLFHLHMYVCHNVKIRNVHISAPDESPNTDGIHIADSTNIGITNSHIGTGDDCVSIGEGTANVNISGVRCGPGHGISIGSLGKYKAARGVDAINVWNCTFIRTLNGLRIKTWAPSLPTAVNDVTFADIVVEGVANPIVIDQFYCPDGSCSRSGQSSVKIKGVKFINVRGSSSQPTSVSVRCSKKYPCRGIEFYGLNLTHQGQPTTALCANADHKFGGSNITPARCS